jgi:rhodanese-related sulfurtransferase
MKKIVFLFLSLSMSSFLFASQLQIKMGEDKGSVDGNWFKKHYKNLPKDIHIIDVRKDVQRAAGYIPDSLHINRRKIKREEFIPLLPKTGRIIFTCQTGMLSLDSYYELKLLKYDQMDRIFYLDGYVVCNKKNECEVHPNEPIESNLDVQE